MQVNIDQRSQDWFKIREGRFTASNIIRLLGKEGLSRTKQSIDTYAFEKALESVYGREEDQLISFDMQRGIDLEPLAFNCFKEIKLYDFIDTQECGFYEIGDSAGASPDGIVSDNSVLEIKCPRRAKFFKIVANGSNEIDPAYYAQMQMQMKATDSDKCYFFNYYVEKGIQYWHEIIVDRDDSMIDLMMDRIQVATEIRDSYIVKLIENPQW